MRKSILSKISGYSSILNSVSPNSDQNLQILRISLKKQMDRKQKLQKLIQKYDQITIQEKNHIKSIKASIIQLKDLQSKYKTKFFVNPIIYVDNHLSKQTREYLCMLLNTFYSKYDENFQCQQNTKVLSKQMNQLLENISKNQENLLKLEKQTIGVQVQLESQLLTQKTKLKDQGVRQKQLEEEYKRVAGICSQFQDRYRVQLNKVQKLRSQCKQLEQKINSLKSQVAQGQLVKAGKQQMMARQMAYQQKFRIQINNIDKDIESQQQTQRIMKQKIKQKKYQIEKLREKYTKINEKAQHWSSLFDLTNVNEVNSRKQNTIAIKDEQKQKNFTLTNSMNNKKSNQSLLWIKKYQDIMKHTKQNFNNHQQPSKLINKNFKKSKDLIDYEIKMKIVELKNEDSVMAMNNNFMNK